MNAFNSVMHYSEGTDIYSVLGEPEDPSSDWSELLCTQLSGYDYIFLSAKINSKLAGSASLGEFIIDVFQLMQTMHERARIYLFTPGPNGRPEFSELDISWNNGLVKDFHYRPVQNPEQKEFIRTLFDHAGLMVGAA